MWQIWDGLYLGRPLEAIGRNFKNASCHPVPVRPHNAFTLDLLIGTRATRPGGFSTFLGKIFHWANLKNSTRVHPIRKLFYIHRKVYVLNFTKVGHPDWSLTSWDVIQVIMVIHTYIHTYLWMMLGICTYVSMLCDTDIIVNKLIYFPQ
jgi:hypothetical protein